MYLLYIHVVSLSLSLSLFLSLSPPPPLALPLSTTCTSAHIYTCTCIKINIQNVHVQCTLYLVSMIITYFLMLSISLEILSRSFIAEKSLPKPNPISPFSLLSFLAEAIGAPHALDVVVVDVAVETVDPAPRLAVTKPDTLVEADEATPKVGVADIAAYAFLKEGGTIAGVISLGRGFPRTLSDTMNMASANCSALSRPVFEISQRFLRKLKTVLL